MSDTERHPNNALGDFYVERDCCIACEAPCDDAPDLMGRPFSAPEDPGCFFAKQPRTKEEVERACRAVAVSCCEAVRYSGDDPAILRRLYEESAYGSCDVEQTPTEEIVAEFVRKTYRTAARHGVHWTYTRSQSEVQTIVACCFGRVRCTLGLFSIDNSTQKIELIVDDRDYRPALDMFKRPMRSFWLSFAEYLWKRSE